MVCSSFVYAQNLGQQPCYSGRGGYCVKIVVPKGYKSTIQQNADPRFAATGGFAQGIKGLEFLGQSANLGDLLANIYYFLLGLVGISALVMFVWGGIEYMLAGDKDPGEAKKRMKNAVYGLVLALTAYLVLYTINPDLVSRLNINLDAIPAQQRTDGGASGTHTNTVPGSEQGTVAHGGTCTAGYECREQGDDCLTVENNQCFGISGGETGRCLQTTDPECRVPHGGACKSSGDCADASRPGLSISAGDQCLVNPFPGQKIGCRPARSGETGSCAKSSDDFCK
ncbi:MAG: hypothetical protein HY007_02280 [Candidatus Sungbacteria bacterium]|nr:hypothetical protein [Candidatus Sungbacteria bacterium]